MATHAFRIVNVFTHHRGALTGNPLCVFENGAEFDSERMQALARQFNLSETTFILPSSRPDARVRIFTPAYEMPFAGHPTLGTALFALFAGERRPGDLCRRRCARTRPRHRQSRLTLIERLVIDDGMGPVNDRLQARRHQG